MYKVKLIIGAFYLSLILSLNVVAQDEASATWLLTDPDNGGTGLSVITAGQVNAENELLCNTETNNYSGPNSSQRIRIEGNEWPANQTTEIEGVYVEFKTSPKEGSSLLVDSVSFGIAGVSINTMKANVYYSTDPAFTDKTQIQYETADESGNYYLQRDSLLYVTATPGVEVGPDESFFIRIYPWVDNDPSIRTGKYLALQDVIISGETESIPVEAVVEWPLDESEDAVISGALTATSQAYSDAMQLYNFKEITKSDGGTAFASTIQTKSQSWIGSDSPVDSLYIQYSVAPKFGATFYSDEFAISMGAWYSQNLRAAVYYSKDPTFQEKKVLIPDTSLFVDDGDNGGAALLEATLEDTVETNEVLYIRVYPYNTESEGWAKLVVIDSVSISGSTVGATSEPPSVATYNIESISTTFAYSGGNITTDGGSEVTSRGVVWSTSSEPTTSDERTTDGTGSGSFSSRLMGLNSGTTYFLRAYATNEAGTSYGREIQFTTLDSKSAPEVTSAQVSDILVESAKSGGEVTSWGGDSVTVRGIVWNTEGEPTTDDFRTEEGSGLGSYVSGMYPLNQDTRYYVRAYATNSIGTGYGREMIFKTQLPQPDVDKVVAIDGSGDYTTVQAAFDDVPENYTGIYTIFVKKGEYYEKLILEEGKVNVQLIGEDRDNTIIWYDDYANIAGGTSQSYSVAINADDFLAKNITFQNVIKNDKTEPNQQAVALVTNGDRQAFYNVNVLGFQDTYYARGSNGTGRVYFKNSYIEGSVDFIFGRNIVVFDSSQIHINRNGGTLTAAATEPESRYGFVFIDNIISADSIGFNGEPITSFHLGRPWQETPRTVFLNTYYPESLNPEGWLSWNVEPGLYGEYNCSGPGCVNSESRVDFATQLSDEEAAEYTLEKIFSKESNPNFARDWMPKTVLTAVSIYRPLQDIPKNFELHQNYPNPFNPTTNIIYSLPKPGHVVMSIYTILGEKVSTLVNRNQKAGKHIIKFDASSLASGVYLYRFETDGFAQTNKMILIK